MTKVYKRFKYNIWQEYLAEMGLLTAKNWGIKYLFILNMLGLNL